MFDLCGKTAIVTGGATGIGEAIVFRLLEAGARVFLADINPDAAEEAATPLGSRCSALQMDVSNRQSIEAAISEALCLENKVEILVNNAGLAGKAAPLWEQSDEDWYQVMNVNLHGPFLVCRAVIPHMRQQRYGHIVNIASVAGKEGNPNMSAYSASKAALIGFTKSVAKEVAKDGICVNAVSPAVIRTKMLEQLTESQVAYMIARIPMGRTGEPEEVAAVVHFLSSGDCSFVTGQCYDMSGGRSVY